MRVSADEIIAGFAARMMGVAYRKQFVGREMAGHDEILQ